MELPQTFVNSQAGAVYMTGRLSGLNGRYQVPFVLVSLCELAIADLRSPQVYKLCNISSQREVFIRNNYSLKINLQRQIVFVPAFGFFSEHDGKFMSTKQENKSMVAQKFLVHNFHLIIYFHNRWFQSAPKYVLIF